MFHCHVNFRGCKTGVFFWPTLSPKAPSKKSSKSTEPSPPLSKSLKNDLFRLKLRDVEGPKVLGPIGCPNEVQNLMTSSKTSPPNNRNKSMDHAI